MFTLSRKGSMIIVYTFSIKYKLRKINIFFFIRSVGIICLILSDILTPRPFGISLGVLLCILILFSDTVKSWMCKRTHRNVVLSYLNNVHNAIPTGGIGFIALFLNKLRIYTSFIIILVLLIINYHI